MKVLELYSGIGGMHLALEASEVKAEVVSSVDINPTANTVYKYNFPQTQLLNRNIQSLTPAHINKLNVGTILMSPPCQPFTRNGLKEDIKDPRTSSFVYILKILPQLNVQNILIENVKGFETSEMRDILIETLSRCEFSYQEFILSPSQFGIPNTRHRYYLIAKKLPGEFHFQTTQSLMESLPKEIAQEVEELFCIGEILEEGNDFDKFYIRDEVLMKRATTFDVCYTNSRRSCCFTKSYGRYVTGTGSVFTNKTKDELDSVFDGLKLEGEDGLRSLKSLEFRFFTPREVCRLMCFPETFKFPASISDKQKYMLLGNSVNIKVVSILINLLMR